jgi:hypothetical protein
LHQSTLIQAVDAFLHDGLMAHAAKRSPKVIHGDEVDAFDDDAFDGGGGAPSSTLALLVLVAVVPSWRTRNRLKRRRRPEAFSIGEDCSDSRPLLLEDTVLPLLPFVVVAWEHD